MELSVGDLYAMPCLRASAVRSGSVSVTILNCLCFKTILPDLSINGRDTESPQARMIIEIVMLYAFSRYGIYEQL